ncbi:type VI secretion system contractile sheath large subunit [Fluviispira multicolorata]|uniref:Type VI secretion system contractile sheath large subunit n=1 Tax=Fluviispira multicolorata TaxID=2654512 RepID=A0A833JDJ8_9BACT|nr:type VI secretion system contractile sheath large subunit [Fluviispira multicolorata]KAB8031905.1 type VI secretion system contractile sheath large subunit [Fluviispira multicolorata]
MTLNTDLAIKTNSFFNLEDVNVSVIDQALAISNLNKNKDQMSHAKEMLTVFADEVISERMAFKKNISHMISERIADIDVILSEQVNEIIHNQEFQKLEASWRGLQSLVKFAEPDDKLHIRVLDATKEDILKDSETAAEFDDSGLFKLVYENEYGTFGGTPYGILVGDYSFGKGLEDIECLKTISKVASAAHAPFIAAASCDLFNIKSFEDLDKPRHLGRLFNSAEFGSWQSFRALEDSKYVTLTLPRVIMRHPYGPNGIPVKEFYFEEDLNGIEHEKYLWGNPAFSLAQRMVDSYRSFGWFSNIRGAENGGVVDSLPYHPFVDSEGNNSFKMPVETIITDRREKELDELGFLSLVYKRGTDTATFFGSKTIHKLTEYDNDLANANAQLSTELPYLMAVSRFAHYLKVIMRDKIGSFTSQGEIEAYLNKWISRYVILDDSASSYIKSCHPLRDARVDILPVPGKVGAYKAVMFLRPHFYLNELTVSLRLVTELPQG